MATCPYCNVEIRLNELPHQGLFKSFRICPQCGKIFEVDKHTKTRQSIFIVVLFFSLAFTVLLYYGNRNWLIPALVSYLIVGVIVYLGNKRLFLVPYKNDGTPTDDN